MTERPLTEVEQHIRFALQNLGARNGHHDFEELCRHFAQARIASNILPATGPVSAGGDGGRDIETFHSTLRTELGPHGAFLAGVSDGVYVFICTIQQERLEKKIADDVAKVLASGETPAAIYAFCIGNLPVGRRKKLQEKLAEKYDGRFEILDREALTVQLAQRDIFWIAERFLDIPAALAPARTDANLDHLPQWYLDDRHRWRSRGGPQSRLADILDLKDGLRLATRSAPARPDLPFWLGLARQLTGDDIPYDVRQRARYEIAYATLQAVSDVRPVDLLISDYLREIVNADRVDPARYADAGNILLLMMAALAGRRTEITPHELFQWNCELRNRLREELNNEESLTRRAVILDALGSLALQPNPLALDERREASPYVDVIDVLDEAGEMPRIAIEPEAWPSAISVDEAMSSWSELAVHLGDTPLFPIQSLATRFDMMAPLFVDMDGYRGLVDALDAAVAAAVGSDAAAGHARTRGLQLLHAKRTVDALHELHNAKVGWWKGDTLRGSVLSMLLIASCYTELKLFQAARYYALAAAFAAQDSSDDMLDMVGKGYLLASECDYNAGSWCSAIELVDVGLIAISHFADVEADDAAADLRDRGAMTLAFIAQSARQVAPKFLPFVRQVIKRHGYDDLLTGSDDEVIAPEAKKAVLDQIDEELDGRPLNDAGLSRVIRFSALGTTWTISSSNRFPDARAAERLAAAIQITLVELARQDLRILPGDIRVTVTTREKSESATGIIRSHHSNETREWSLDLLAYADGQPMDHEQVQTELLVVIGTIIFDITLLPAEEFFQRMKDAFLSGLTHKIGSVRPYDELGIPRSVYDRTPRAHTFPPRDPRSSVLKTADDLRWREEDGPTYDTIEALDRIQRRYDKIPRMIPRLLERLKEDLVFRSVVMELRARGWLDWQILQALVNIALSRRLAAEGLAQDTTVDEVRSRALALDGTLDETFANPLNLSLTDFEMQEGVMLISLAEGWGLDCHQATPDLRALRSFLGRRYRLYEDDVDHPNLVGE